MVVPLQLNVDLNEIIKKFTDIVKDVRDFSQESARILTRFKQEFGWTESLIEALNRRLFNMSRSPLGDQQREAIEDTVQSLNRCWEDFDKLVKQSSIPSKSPERAPKMLVDSVQNLANSRRLWWAVRGKSRANKILQDVKRSNDYLKISLQEIFKLLDQTDLDVTSLLESDADLRKTGLSAQITRLGIRRGRIASDKNILRHPNFLDLANSIRLEAGTNMQTAIFAQSKTVLVECYLVRDFTTQMEDKAIQLAMLLSKPRLDGFSILNCICLVPNKEESRYKFVFDIDNLISSENEDGLVCSKESIISSFRTLHFRLSRPNTTGSSSVFRYAKIHEATFKPLSILHRLNFARSLARTVSNLHLAEWVHGNITSRNVWFFQTREQEAAQLPVVQIGKPYLFGFQFTRLVVEYSDQWGWTHITKEDNIYRHPDRQIFKGRGPNVPHAPLHDIYSLGVIFLEIGLGQPAEDLLKLWAYMQGKTATENATSLDTTRNARSIFIEFAERFLPEKMGDSFSDITRRCLEGEIMSLDEDRDLGVEVTLSTAFQAHVIEPLDRFISAISTV
jgi:hypothetical protein